MIARRQVLRMLLAGAAGVGLAPMRRRTAAGSEPVMREMVLGRSDAPVTIIEYFSLTCSHCASFHNITFPELKSAYIDTGRVLYTVRDFPWDAPALRAAMLARCAGDERYFAFLEMLFRSFDNWTGARDPLDALAKLGRLGGIDRRAFDACMADRALEEFVLNSRLQAQREYGVDATPTFIISGKKYEGARSFDWFEKILAPLLRGS